MRVQNIDDMGKRAGEPVRIAAQREAGGALAAFSGGDDLFGRESVAGFRFIVGGEARP